MNCKCFTKFKFICNDGEINTKIIIKYFGTISNAKEDIKDAPDEYKVPFSSFHIYKFIIFINHVEYFTHQI